MENLEERIKIRYAYYDAEILFHGDKYFRTASKIYQDLEPDSVDTIYPLLTLLGISAELFFKAFDVGVVENQGKLEDRKIVNPNNYGHNLDRLFDGYSTKDSELFRYLIDSYKSDTGRNLEKDLLDYASVFVESRYIFQHEKGKYLNDIDAIFHLVESLYNSMHSLYKK
ncbi:hypothetical protein [Psychrobacter sp. NPDC077938]|uniref:hypothetical protein n=1 Tax=Psychrobacter sp. NPDC077938 TaxID=3364494 RepID=UPI0037C865B4